MPEISNDAPTWQDPIVAEVRATREALFAEAGYDIHEFCRRVRARQAESGHVVVNLRHRAMSNDVADSVERSKR